MVGTFDTDVVVVGAGTGGLTAAAYLAAAGRRVVVVDRGHAPGGHATVFARDGYEFDVGLHYLGSTDDGRPATEALLRPLGVTVDYRPLDPVDTLVLPDGEIFRVPPSVERFRANLHQALPGERAAVDRYLDTLDAITTQVAALTRRPAVTELPQTVRRTGLLLRHARSTLGGFWDDLGLSARARTLLGWISGVYAVAPSEASLVMHGMATRHYLNGAWYPHGGGAVLSESLANVVRTHDGQFLLGHEVTRIHVRDGRVTGVEASGPDGAPVQVTAPVVVAAGDIKHTFLELLDPRVVPSRLRRKVRGFEMALPLAVVYLVINRDLAAEGMPVTNFSAVPRDDVEGLYAGVRRGELPIDPVVWVTAASLKDPDNPRLCPPGHTNLQLMTVVPPQPRAWGLQTGEARGQAYQEAKDRLRDRMLGAADRAIPGLSDAVVYVDLATPYTEERYMGVTDGTSYGIAATPDQTVFGRPGPKTPIGGLFLAGASTRRGHGITGTMAGGIDTATAVLGRPAIAAVTG